MVEDILKTVSEKQGIKDDYRTYQMSSLRIQIQD